jgi:3-methylfumaryl-CoA hydratase
MDARTAIESCSASTTRRIAAMLNLDHESIHDGGVLPRGWHFPLLAGDTARAALRQDGFPGLGVTMPELDLPRLVLSRRSIEFYGDIDVGGEVRRKSWIHAITHKGSPDAPFAIVEVDHELTSCESTSNNDLLVRERQTYALLPALNGDRPAAERQPSTPTANPRPDADLTTSVTPDDTMLFQYSALCFNSHRIHIDRDYARNVEHYPDLVVNGGLTALLCLTFIRAHIDEPIISINLRHVAPLFCDQPLTIEVDAADQSSRTFRVVNSVGTEAVTGSVGLYAGP